MFARFRRFIARRNRPGRRAERYAATWLKRRGYQIIERNYTIGKDEADIIARVPGGEMVAIVEVKSADQRDAVPELRVGRQKQFFLTRLAAQLQHDPRFVGVPMRFDVIAITWPPGEQPMVKHYENAFESVV